VGEDLSAPVILIDFDGTACPIDVADALLTRFTPPGWQEIDAASQRDEITLRAGIEIQASMLPPSRSELLDFVLSRFAVAPDLVGFCAWAESCGHEIAVVSDGFGFYVKPMLRAAGLSRVPVLTNRLDLRPRGWRLLHPHSHPICTGCGTCKMKAIAERQRAGCRVVFVGDGPSDRFAAYFADLVFAKGWLAEFCSKAGLPFLPWQTFTDVSSALQHLPGPIEPKQGPVTCPGWITDSAVAG
jgi:2-hydroxy-3-keto-5-methylthiopentenyl-1-phosphate phosphatase